MAYTFRKCHQNHKTSLFVFSDENLPQLQQEKSRFLITKLASSLFLSLHNSQKQIDPHLGLGENLHRGAMLNKHKGESTNLESNKSILYSFA
jgi:hypothetical protein